MINDIRFAWRTLWKTPGFTLVAILALALGIGANTAIFTVVKNVVLKPLPYRQSHQLFTIWETFLPSGWGTVSTPNFGDWREQNHSFEAIEAFSSTNRNLQGVDQPERLRATAVTANLLRMVGVPAHLGRVFEAGEDQPDKASVAVLGSALWKRRFSADPKIVGKTISLDGEQHTVIGVMPDGFQFPPQSRLATDIFIPLRVTADQRKQRGSHWMFAVGRLKDGVSTEVASADLKAVAARLARDYPKEQQGRSIRLQSLSDVVSGEVRPVLFVLLAAVGAVLLIACANVANLLLARAAVREREMAVRTALGSSRLRLVRLMLAESFVIAMLGGVVGLAVAYWGVDGIVALAGTALPRASEIQVDGSIFLYLLTACILTAFIFGLAPALRASQTDLTVGLRDGGSKGSVGGTKQWLRNALVVAELALAFVLLVSTGTLMRTLLGLMSVESGVKTENVMTFLVSPPEKKYPNEQMAERFYKPLLDHLRTIPGVRAAGAINMLPMQNWGYNGEFQIDGRPHASAGEAPRSEFREVTPGYFQALNIPILEGRDIQESDAPKRQQVALVNKALAKLYFPNESAVGHRIGDPEGWTLIVGVAGDVRQAGLDRPAMPEIYFSSQQGQLGARQMAVLVRGSTPPATLAPAIRNAVRTFDRDQPIFAVKTMESVVDESVASQRLNFRLMGIFSALAMLLASAGIYGVMSYLVNQRTREFGVRMALGAASSDVLRLVLRESAILAGVAIALGAVVALATARVLQQFIPGLTGAGAPIFLGVAALVAVVVAAATLIPAWRAMSVHPMEALRWE